MDHGHGPMSIDRSVSGDESHDGGSLEGKRVSVVQRLKNGLFGVLFVMLKETRKPLWLVMFEMIVEFLQDLAFPFAYHHFPWNKDQASWFEQLLRIPSPEYFILANKPAFYVVIAIAVLLLADAAFTAYSFSRDKYRFLWLLKVLRALGGLFTTVLSIPFVAIMASMLTCYDADTCWSSGLDIFYKVLALVVGSCLIVFTLFVAANYFEQDPTRKVHLSRPHGRVDLLYVMQRIYLAIVFELVTSHWVLVISCVVTSLLSAFAYTWYIPYHNYFFARLRVMATWIYAFASLCLVVTQLTDDPEKSQSALFFFLFSPVIAWVSLTTLDARRRMLAAKTVKTCRSPFEVELKIRFHLAAAGCLRKSIDMNTTEGFDKTVFVREINGWFQDAVKRFPESSILHIFWGQFHLHSTRKRNLALTEFVKTADDFKPHIDEQFIVYRMRKLLTEDATFNKNSMDAIAYVTFQRDMREARKYDRRAAHFQMLFWRELSESRPDTKKLYATGLKISVALSVARESYERLMRTNASSPQVLRMYAG